MPLDETAFNLVKELAMRRAVYLTYANYYDGKHNLTFASEKFWNAFGSMFRAFADNLCPTVVEACTDRLNLVGFDPDDAQRGASDAWQIWRDNRMDQRASEVHSEALISGDAYVIVWPGEDNKPVFYPNCAQVVNVKFENNTPGKIAFAVKEWTEKDKKSRINVYYPDRIEKYISKNAISDGTTPTRTDAYDERDDDEGGSVIPNPYDQVPVFHFANNARVGHLGKSELKDMKPLQDALNKAVCDMLVGMEFVAWPQRYMTGVEITKDPQTGKPINPFKPGADRIWAVPDKEAKFGEFSQTHLDQFIAVQESFRLEIARVSRTPLHYLMPTTGQFPSGESLKTAEAPFVAKVKRRQVAFGNVWEDVMRFALKIESKEAGMLSAQWQNAEPRSDAEMIQNAQIKSTLGVPTNQILRELGYTEEQIANFAIERTNDYPPSALGALRTKSA